MKEIIEMDRLFHSFSLIEKLTIGNGIFDVDRSNEISDGANEGSDSIVRGGEIMNSLSGGYLGAYKRLLPEIAPYSDDGGATYILRANRDELNKMRERMSNEILETTLSEKRGVTLEFLRKLSTRGGRFSGSVLKEGIPSILEFIPLLYENCEDIEMHFSYEELGKNVYEVSVGLSYTFIKKRQVLSPKPYLEYDEDSKNIIFKGCRLPLTGAEISLLRVFIDEGKSALYNTEIVEIIENTTNMEVAKKRKVKKYSIYNVRKGLNKNLESIFSHKETVYMNGRDGILHFRFPEFIEEK